MGEKRIKGLGKLNRKERKEYGKYYRVFSKPVHLPKGVSLPEDEENNLEEETV